MRIHLLCDQKWRDLPNLAAIKLRLEAHGHRVLLSATKDASPMIKAFRPDCVVFNHLWGSRHRAMATALRKWGVAIVLLPTEGMTHPTGLGILAGENTDLHVADLILSWNAPVAGMIRERWGFDEAVTPVVGCTRFDFYDSAFAAAVVARENFCRQYSFDASRPIVTWATQYVFAHIEKPSPQRERFLHDTEDFDLRGYYEKIGTRPEEVPAFHADARRAAADAVLRLAKVLSQAQIIIKPHPAEDQDFYRALISAYGLANVRFCPRDYIWNVLNASDVHLHRHCTTAVEAWNWDKPTIEMGMNTPQNTWPDREAGSEVAYSSEDLIAIVGHYLGGGQVSESRRLHRRNYIDRWFGGARGRRCVNAADIIHRFLTERGKRRRFFSPLAGLPGSPRQTITSVARYALNQRPNQSLVRRIPTDVIDPKDKQITRRDVRDYARILAAVLQ